MSETPGDTQMVELLTRLAALESRIAALELARRAGDRAAEPTAAPVHAAPQPAKQSFLRERKPVEMPAAEMAAPAAPLLPVLPSEPVALAEEPPPVIASAAPEKSRAGLGSFEQFVGGKLIGWIAAIFLLIAAGIGVKVFAPHFTPELRIAAGAIAGLALFVGADVVLRRKLIPLAGALAGGGLGILTLTNYAAFRWYGFFEFGTAFGIACAITLIGYAWSVWRALLSAMLLAELGGFLTPVLISQRTSSPWGLSAYVTFLSMATAFLAQKRAWRSPAVVAAVASVILMVAWAGDAPRNITRSPEGQQAFAGAVTLLAAALLGEIGWRAWRAGTARKIEAATTVWTGLFAALCLLVSLADHQPRLLGIYLAGYCAGLGTIAWLGQPESVAVRGAALAFSIAAFTGMLPCFLERTPLGIAWALEAAALAWMERRTKTFVPMVGAMAAHGLVATKVFAVGAGLESTTYLWSERLVLYGIELASLYCFSWALRGESGVRGMVARLALVVAQAFIAYMLYDMLPADRVTLAWFAQAVGIAFLLARTKLPEYAVVFVLLIAFAAVRFWDRGEYVVGTNALPFLNVRAAIFGVASAAWLALAWADGSAKLGNVHSESLVRRLAAILLSVGVATELSFLVSRRYGSEPRWIWLEFGLGDALYQPFWNGRFVALAALAGGIALATKIKILGGEIRDGLAGFCTIVAHLVLLAAVSMEAMGIADSQVGIMVTNDWAAFTQSRVQVALSISIALLPALALAIGFRRSKIHRYYGLAGLLIAAGKVVLVDMSDVALEWRMLSFLGLGALLMAGAYVYARAARAAREPEPPAAQQP